MLKVGYAIMLLAGVLLVGFVAFEKVRLLLLAPAISSFFKAIILLGAVGVIVTIAGLIWERRKESENADRDDGDG